MSVSNRNSGIHASPHCSMKIKEENDSHLIIFDDRKDFVWLYQKSNVTNFDELLVNNSSHTKGTICLVNGCQGDGFSSAGTQTGAIKLAMAGA